jgi:hypothetical protein
LDSGPIWTSFVSKLGLQILKVLRSTPPILFRSAGKGWKWTHTDGPRNIHWWWAFIGGIGSVSSHRSGKGAPSEQRCTVIYDEHFHAGCQMAELMSHLYGRKAVLSTLVFRVVPPIDTKKWSIKWDMPEAE